MADSQTTARRGVLTAGCIVVDVNKTLDHYPQPERLALIDNVTLGPGGPAMNMATDLVRLAPGLPVAVNGVVGQDDHGRFILDICARDGIDASGIAQVPATATAFSDVMVERDSGRRTFFYHAGSNDLFEPGHVRLEQSTARILHLGAPGLHARMDADDGWVKVLRRAQELGLRTNLELVSLEPELVRRITEPCLPHLDYLIANDVEAAAVSGASVRNWGSDGAGSDVEWTLVEEAARRIIDAGVRRLVVIHFPAGCVAAAPGGRVWRQGSLRMPVEAIISSVGAGDAFAAGVLWGLHEGWPVEACLELAVASAAASLRGLDTHSGIGTAEECLVLTRQYGYRP